MLLESRRSEEFGTFIELVALNELQCEWSHVGSDSNTCILLLLQCTAVGMLECSLYAQHDVPALWSLV